MDKNKQINTQEEARQYAIDWQTWQSEQSLSYGEIAEWQGIFTTLAYKFGLFEEFVENGII
jgi:isoleucyl-tRNA synthetase